jgi:hypothetical protein
MPPETREIKRILDKHESYLISHRHAILTGAIQGIKKGGASGARRGAWDGLKECLSQELISVSGVTIEDIASIVSQLAISSNVSRAVGPAIEDGIKAYFGEVGTDVVGLQPDQRPGVDAVIQLVTQRHEVNGQWMMDRLSRNPISRGIAVGIRSALEDGLSSSVQTFRARLGETPEGQREGRMGEETGRAADVLRNTVENAVTRVVEDVIYELVKQMTRRVINNLISRLKAKEIQKLQNALGKISQSEFEEGMSKATSQLAEKLSRSHPNETSLLRSIDNSFGTSYGKYLLSFSNRFPVVPVVLGIIAILTISIVVYANSGNNGANNGGPGDVPNTFDNEAPDASASIEWIDGLTIGLSSEGSWDPDGEIVSYHWDFGDGTTSPQPNPEHTYRPADGYTATLTVVDDKGEEGSDVVFIEFPIEQPQVANKPPVAVAIIVGEELRDEKGALAVIRYRDVWFSSEGSWDPDGEIVSYHWDFGDETTSDLKTPRMRTFMADVTYTITLIVTDDREARGEARLTVGPR